MILPLCVVRKFTTAGYPSLSWTVQQWKLLGAAKLCFVLGGFLERSYHTPYSVCSIVAIHVCNLYMCALVYVHISCVYTYMCVYTCICVCVYDCVCHSVCVCVCVCVCARARHMAVAYFGADLPSGWKSEVTVNNERSKATGWTRHMAVAYFGADLPSGWKSEVTVNNERSKATGWTLVDWKKMSLLVFMNLLFFL